MGNKSKTKNSSNIYESIKRIVFIIIKFFSRFDLRHKTKNVPCGEPVQRVTMEEITNKDLMYHIKEIKHDVKEMKEVSIPELNARVKTTNGSVADIKAWKERITGATWAFGIAFTILIIPLVTWAFITIENLPKTIKKTVDQALSEYDIQIK